MPTDGFTMTNRTMTKPRTNGVPAADAPAGRRLEPGNVMANTTPDTPPTPAPAPTPAPPQPQKLHWWTNPKTLLRYVLSLDDSPHHVALGVSVGMFIGLTPTVGIQMAETLLVYYLCLPFFKFSRTAALVTVYISNPVTMVPLYWFDYQVGRLFFGGEMTKGELADILKYEGFEQWWATITTLFVELGWTMLVGSLLVGTVAALISYPVMRNLVTRFHRSNQSGSDVTGGDATAPPGETRAVA